MAKRFNRNPYPTSQASRHKTRKHKVRRCRFRDTKSAMFDYRRNQVKREKDLLLTIFYRILTIITNFPERRRERDDIVSGRTPGMKRHHFNQKRW
jgi:hypothetical protein